LASGSTDLTTVTLVCLTDVQIDLRQGNAISIGPNEKCLTNKEINLRLAIWRICVRVGKL